MTWSELVFSFLARPPGHSNMRNMIPKMFQKVTSGYFPSCLALFALFVSTIGEVQKPDYFPLDKPYLESQTSHQIKKRPGFLQQDSFKGFRYKDNKSKFRWEEGRNGMAQLSFDTFLPPSLTVCLRGRIMYNRHGDKNYWFSVILNTKTPRIGVFPVDFAFVQNSNGNWIVSSHAARPYQKALMNKEEQEKAKKDESWPSKNSLRKWAHVCLLAILSMTKHFFF